VIDITGAVFGVVAMQAALRRARHHGKGQRVSSVLFESAALMMSTHMAGMTPRGSRRGRCRRGKVPGRSTRSSKLAADRRLATNVARLTNELDARREPISPAPPPVAAHTRFSVCGRCGCANDLRRAVVEEGIRRVDLWTARYKLETVS
jgi:hypothetical protein